jgi:hypothetical protein
MVVEVGIDQSGPLSALLEKYPNYAHTWHVDLADIPRVLAIFPRESLNAPPT